MGSRVVLRLSNPALCSVEFVSRIIIVLLLVNLKRVAFMCVFTTNFKGISLLD